jgi:hypothetical protein
LKRELGERACQYGRVVIEVLAIMDGQEWIPPIKSRQPGTVKSQGEKDSVTGNISDSDHSGEVGKAKFIGFDKGKQVQKKDTGVHVQP